jgi:hypothetical protein
LSTPDFSGTDLEFRNTGYRIQSINRQQIGAFFKWNGANNTPFMSAIRAMTFTSPRRLQHDSRDPMRGDLASSELISHTIVLRVPAIATAGSLSVWKWK